MADAMEDNFDNKPDDGATPSWVVLITKFLCISTASGIKK